MIPLMILSMETDQHHHLRGSSGDSGPPGRTLRAKKASTSGLAGLMVQATKRPEAEAPAAPVTVVAA